jgi:hypothetical protein
MLGKIFLVVVFNLHRVDVITILPLRLDIVSGIIYTSIMHMILVYDTISMVNGII